MRKCLILIGAPGSGKGTHSDILSKRLEVAHISTGDILRREINSNTDIGKKIQNMLESGNLVPDSIMVELLKKRLTEKDCDNGFILDGYPRTLEQVESINKIFNDLLITEYKVIELEVNLEDLKKRILGRFMCAECGAIFNKYTSPTKVDGVCDNCNSTKFKRRDDDTEETIKERFNVYNTQTKPILEFYKNIGKYNSVNCNVDKEVSVNEIIKLFNCL